MRITANIATRHNLAQIQAADQRLDRAQTKASSQQRITRPSDDPLGSQLVLSLRSTIDGIGDHQDAIDGARGWLDVTDGSMQSLTDVIHRARELAVQGATGSQSAVSRNAIASEVDQLVQEAKDALNVTYQDHYVFSGQQTSTPPYLSGAVDTYQGDNNPINRLIGPSMNLQINTLGSTIGGSGAGDGKILDTLRNLAADLRANNQVAIGSTDLAALDANLDQVTQAQSITGTAINSLDAANARLADFNTAATTLLSKTQDVDVASAMIDFYTQQQALQATLQAGAKVIQPSLLDFLRS